MAEAAAGPRLPHGRAAEILGALRGRKVLVVGDLMLDAYLEGSVERISPEAPVPVLEKKSLHHRLGGSANVGLNLARWGADVRLAGVVGADEGAKLFLDACAAEGIGTAAVTVDRDRPTAVKTRVTAGRQQLLRIDEESRAPLRSATVDALNAAVTSAWSDLDAVIVSDYGKGVVTPPTWGTVRALRERKALPLVVDPKRKNYGLYRGADAMTHNHHEAGDDAGLPCLSDAEVEAVGRALLAKYGMRRTLITRGPQGMALFGPEGMRLVPTFARQVFDVSGAGDTVIALFTASMAAGATAEEAALLANHAAGVVVSKFGTATASVDEILDDIRQHAD